MIVLPLRMLGRDGAIRGKVVKGGSSVFSSSDSQVRKDEPSSHKLASSLGEINLTSVSRDGSYSRI